MNKKIFIVAGEVSGDMHGAKLVQEIRSLDPDVTFSGIGGEGMRDAGVKLLFDAGKLAVVGISEVFTHLLQIIHAQRIVRKSITRERPDLVILIDYPDFNLFVAAKARSLGIPVAYYISPQVWAWRCGRVKKIKRDVNQMIVILPFEVEFYGKYGLDVDFVGHPLLDIVEYKADLPSFCEQLGLDRNKPIVGLLPGSRSQEIQNLLPCMLDAAEKIAERVPGIQFVIPLAPSIKKEYLENFLRDVKVNVRVAEHGVYETMQISRCIVVASGTVTLEAAIIGVPMVIIYKISKLSYLIGKALAKVANIGLVNLVAQRVFVPELVQEQVTAQRIAQEVFKMLDDAKYCEDIKIGLAEVRGKLGSPGASKRAAEIICRMISNV